MVVQDVAAVDAMDFLIRGNFDATTVAYKILVASVGGLVSSLVVNLLRKVVDAQVRRMLSGAKCVGAGTGDLMTSAVSLVVAVLLAGLVVGALRTVGPPA